jgi:hypothetical protein
LNQVCGVSNAEFKGYYEYMNTLRSSGIGEAMRKKVSLAITPQDNSSNQP